MVGIFSNEAALTRLVGASLVALLKRLQLANDRRTSGDLIGHAERERRFCHEFLLALAREEVAHRAQTRLQRWVRRAHCSESTTIEECDLSVRPELGRTVLGSCIAPRSWPRAAT